MSLCSCYYVPTMLLWCDVHTSDIKHSTWGIIWFAWPFRYVVMSQVWTRLKTIAFWGTTRPQTLTMHKFISENLRVNIWRDNFTSDYLRVNLPKLSTLSEPSIAKFIQNQSEHLSKLTWYHLKKRTAKWSRRAREPSRIPLAFLRGLNKKNI